MHTIKNILFKLFVVLLGLLCLILLTYLGKQGYHKLVKRNSRIEYIQSRLKAETGRLDRIIESVQKTPEDLAYIMEFHKMNTKEMQIIQESVLFNNDELFGCAIAFEPYKFHSDSLYFAPYIYRQGDKSVFVNLNDSAYDYFNKDWYLIPKTTRKAGWSEPYFDKGVSNLLITTYSVPFYLFENFKEEFAGIITIDVSVDWLIKSMESISKTFNANSVLLSENGTIISSSNRDWVYNETIFTLASELNLPELREIGRELQNGKTGMKKTEAVDPQKDWIIFYSSVKINKWGFIILLPVREIDKSDFGKK